MLSFANTELVERTFPSYAYIKRKYGSKLDVAPDLILYLFSFESHLKSKLHETNSRIRLRILKSVFVSCDY